MNVEIWKSNMDAVRKHLNDCNRLMDMIKEMVDLQPNNVDELIDDLNKLTRMYLLLDTVVDFLSCDLVFQHLIQTYRHEIDDDKGQFIILRHMKDAYDMPLIPRFKKMLSISKGMHLNNHNARKFLVEVQKTMTTICECYQNEFDEEKSD